MTRISIDQFAPSVRERDAIGAEVIALQGVLRKFGYSSRIFAEAPGRVGGRRVHEWRKCQPSVSGLLLIHYSHGSAAYPALCSLPQRKILLYHAATPVKYLVGLDPAMSSTSAQANSELPRYANSIRSAVAHSVFSAQDLQSAGFRRVEVVPYLLSESLWRSSPEQGILTRFQGDGWKNLLVVGRIVPNKCLADCLFVFDYLKRYVDPRWRLFFVGSWKGTESYRDRLERLAEHLQLDDVEFTGSVSQAALMAYYQIADVLLSMSEHEGFCVPLLEAMRMDVPVFAYAAGSAPEVVGDAGVLFEAKDWPLIAETAALVASDRAVRDKLLSRQRDRLAAFSPDLTERKWKALIERLMAG